MRIFPAVFLCVAALTAGLRPLAAEPSKIAGAFGQKLGDVFDVSTAIGVSETTGNESMYQFDPKGPYRAFNRYYVLITPTTKRIYCIWGIGPTENPTVCSREQDVIMAALEEKYGPPEKQGFAATMSNRKVIKQGRFSVGVECSGLTKGIIEIRYLDAELSDLADKERIQEEAKKVDKSGL